MSPPLSNPATVTDGPKNRFFAMTCRRVSPLTPLSRSSAVFNIAPNEAPVTTVTFRGGTLTGTPGPCSLTKELGNHADTVLDLRELFIRGRWTGTALRL